MRQRSDSLRAAVGETFYNVSVTPTELWKEVGRALRLRRVEINWRPIDVERAGGPSYKTVQAIEAGEAGTVESLAKCAAALELSIVDVLQTILDANQTALTPEAAQVVRKEWTTHAAGRSCLGGCAADDEDAAATGTRGARPPRQGR